MSQPSSSSQSSTGYNIVFGRPSIKISVEERGAQERVILRSRRISAGPIDRRFRLGRKDSGPAGKDLNRCICELQCGGSAVQPGTFPHSQRCQNDNTFSPLFFDSIILVCYGAEVPENSKE